MQLEPVIKHLFKLTHFEYLIPSIFDYNERASSKYYKDREDKIKKLKPAIVAYLTENGHPIESNIINNYIRFILMLPIEEEGDVYQLNLKPLMPMVRSLLKSLLDEALAEGIIKEKEIEGCFHKLYKAAETIILHPDMNAESQTTNTSINFFEKLAGNDAFNHFVLAYVAYFYWRVMRAYSISMRRDKVIIYKKDGQIVSPLRKILINPHAMLAEVLEFMEEECIVPQELTLNSFWELIEESCISNRWVVSTRDRRWFEYGYFLKATDNFKALWGWQNWSDKNLQAIEHFIGEEDHDDPTGPERSLILADASGELESDATEEMQWLVPVSAKDTKDKEHQEYLRSLRREKMIAHMRSGGLVLLRHSWKDPRAFTLERFAALLGYLTNGKKTDQLLHSSNPEARQDGIDVLILLEAACTGTSLDRIKGCQSGIAASSSLISPVGFHLDIESISNIFNYTLGKDEKDKALKRIGMRIKEFNEIYPDLKINFGSIVYGGKAWLIDKMGYDRLLVSHICGLWLPGLRASGQYVRIEGIAEKWKKSCEKFCHQLLKVAKKTDLPVLDRLADKNTKPSELMRMSIPVISEWLSTLDGQMNLREERSQNMRLVNIPSDEKIIKLLEYLIQKIEEAEKDEKIIWLSALAVVVLCGALLMRPGESKDMGLWAFSFSEKAVVVAGKKNKAFAEYRVLPLAKKIGLFFYEFINMLLKEKKTIAIDSRLIQKKETVIRFLDQAFSETGLELYELYSLRKWGATKLYKMGILLEHWQALMGHSQVGFESMGCFSRIHFSELRKHFEYMAECFEPYIERAIREVKKV